MRSLEILLNITHRQVQVDLNIILMQDPGKKMYKQTKRSILFGSKLYFHGPKLNPPSYLIINWYLKSNRIPISTI